MAFELSERVWKLGFTTGPGQRPRIRQIPARATDRILEEIGRAKEARDLPTYEPKREDDVFRNVTDHNHGPLTADAVKGIFERIIDEMRTLQRMRREQKKQGENEC